MSNTHCDSSIYHNDVLAKLTQADRALAMAPQLALEAPHTGDAVTQDFLQGVFGKTVPSAILEKLEATDAHDGMTNRTKWSLGWNDIGRDAGLPDSIFVKATPSLAMHREMLAVLHMDEAETNFYKIIQPEIPNLAPRALYAESYCGGRHLIILDDIVAKGCTPFWQKDNCGMDHVRAVARALATLHARYWDSNRFSGDLAWVRPRTRRYGWAWLTNLTHDVRLAFLEKADEEILPESLRPLLKLWDTNADLVYDYFETLPQTVLHGDPHLGNTFAYPDDRAGLFDWQVVFRGYGPRDLAYFAVSMDNDERAAHEKEVFDLYMDTLQELGVELNRNEAWNYYCLSMLERWEAGIMTWVHGTYNHGGLERAFKSIGGCLIDNDVQTRLENLLKQLK